MHGPPASARAGLDVARALLAREQDATTRISRSSSGGPSRRMQLADLEDTLARFTAPEAWRSAMIRSTILGRLVRRFAALKSADGDSACARLLASAPTADLRGPLLTALDEAMRGERPSSVAPELEPGQLLAQLTERSAEYELTRLAARLKYPRGTRAGRAIAKDDARAEADRVAMLDLLGELKDRASVPLFLDLATHGEGSSSARATAAFGALGRFDDSDRDSTAGGIPASGRGLAIQARELLLSRASWAGPFWRRSTRKDRRPRA